MAKFSLSSIFESLLGKLNRKDEIIYRRTRRYDDRGRVVLDGKHAYMQVNKRNFKDKPPRGEEKLNMDIIARAQQMAREAIAPDSPDLPAWRERFLRQLHTEKPDPEIPVKPNQRKGKIYVQLDRFVYAVIYYRLREAERLQHKPLS